MTIRVALDVTPELIGSTGVARYSRELRRALGARSDCEVFGFALGRKSHPVPAGVRHVPVPLRLAHAGWRTFGWPPAERLARAERIDIVHSVDLIPPPAGVPLAVTVHDLLAGELPALHPGRAGRTQRRRQAAVRRARAVLAVSQSTADALVACGVDPGRIHVTPNGLTRLPEPAEPPPSGRPFILAVGSLEPRKGHDRLLRAFAAGSFERFDLVFAGPDAGCGRRLRELAVKLGVEDRLRILGFVDDAVLAGLYGSASVLCMPSHGEGFGIPVLEALAAGLPVVASDVPAIREVADGAALLVAPGAVDPLRSALERLLCDIALRESLQRQGKARAETFTWAATAEATVAAYQAALEQSSRLTKETATRSVLWA